MDSHYLIALQAFGPPNNWIPDMQFYNMDLHNNIDHSLQIEYFNLFSHT